MAAPDGPSAQQTMLLVLLGFFYVDFWGGEGAQVLAASCMLQSLLRSGPDNRGTLWVMRKVRAPQGRKLANGQAGRPDGKRRRKEDSHLRRKA